MLEIKQGVSHIDALSRLIDNLDKGGFYPLIIITEGADIRKREVRHINQYNVIAELSDGISKVCKEIINALLNDCETSRAKSIPGYNDYFMYVPMNGKRKNIVYKILDKYADVFKSDFLNELKSDIKTCTEVFLAQVE